MTSNLTEPERLSTILGEGFHLAELVPFKRVPKEFPDPIHISGVHRWRKDGVNGVQLRAVKVPGIGWCTTRAWLSQFIFEVTVAREAASRPARRARRRQRRADAFAHRGRRHP